jgi:DNA processing protein
MTSATLTPAELLGSLNNVEQKNAPKLLYLAGDASLLKRGPRVSVVGSREASEEGLARARSLARALVSRNIIVVSGLAAGIDTAAHTAAIDAGGHTIAVLGTPLDDVYPRENASLQAQIIGKYLAVSQFAPGTKTQPSSFLQRNRTMALLTDATVIVEAGEKSGTLHQGWEALRLGRLLFLLESVANDSSLSWPEKMIHHGAQVLSRDTMEAALEDIPAVTSYRHEELRGIA